MNKALTQILIAIFIICAAGYAVYSYTSADPIIEDSSQSGQYFSESLWEIATEETGLMPIEGYDAGLLMSAYPGFITTDFEGVETFEGHYELVGGELQYKRTSTGPVSSAETTISTEGYTTLLSRVSERLSIPIESTEDIDSIIEKINTKRVIKVGLDQSGSAFGVTITILEVLEDSRCPIDVQCIQAGTVRLRATLESGLGTADQEFKLNETITTEAEEITLTMVAPQSDSESQIESSEYVFTFEVTKRENY